MVLRARGTVLNIGLVRAMKHKVELTGTAVPEKEALKENKDVPTAPHYLKVTAMKHISASCP